jgi:hypothetical protein
MSERRGVAVEPLTKGTKVAGLLHMANLRKLNMASLVSSSLAG